MVSRLITLKHAARLPLRVIKKLLSITRHQSDKYKNELLLDICTMCGADCVYCLHQRKGLIKHQLMNKATFMKIIQILQREKYKLVHLYMSGEPFLHPDLPEFINAIAEHDMNSSIASKLFIPIEFDRLHSALGRCDKTAKKVQFLITIDSFRQETQNKITRGIDVNKVKENLCNMVKIRIHHKSASFIFLTVVNRYNENELDEIKRTIIDLGFGEWYEKQMGYFMPSYADKDDVEEISECIPAHLAYRKRFCVAGGRIISFQKECDVGPMAIGPDGNVTICCHDMLHKICVGNILDENSLRTIANSRLYKQIASAGSRMSLDICRGCN